LWLTRIHRLPTKRRLLPFVYLVRDREMSDALIVGRVAAEIARRQQGYAILQRSLTKFAAAGAQIILGPDTGLEDLIFGYAEHKESGSWSRLG
jgi:hypothetical protein